MSNNRVKVDKPLIFFLHGFPNNSNIWIEQVLRFENEAEIVLLTFPGVSRKGNVEKTNIGSIVETIASNVVERKNLDPDRKILFVGHDVGACILNEVTAKYPQLVDEQILISGGGIQQIGGRMMTWKQLRKSYYVGFFCLPIIPQLIRKFSHILIEKLIYRNESPTWSEKLKNPQHHSFEFIYLYRQLMLRFILGKSEKFNCTRTVFVASAKDPYLMLPTSKEMNSFFFDFTLKIVKSGHWSPFTDCETINKIINQSINTLETI